MRSAAASPKTGAASMSFGVPGLSVPGRSGVPAPNSGAVPEPGRLSGQVQETQFSSFGLEPLTSMTTTQGVPEPLSCC